MYTLFDCFQYLDSPLNPLDGRNKNSLSGCCSADLVDISSNVSCLQGGSRVYSFSFDAQSVKLMD